LDGPAEALSKLKATVKLQERVGKMKEYPKTSKYDSSWIEKNWMGPNQILLLEDLCEHLDLRSGMKV
jgi:hypothetical protein